MKNILILPFLLAGHITPMLNLCCKLARITLRINQDAVETVDLANKLGVPRVVLFITVFLECGIILQMPRLISQKIYSPFTKTNDNDLDVKLIQLPGYPAFKTLHSIFGFLRRKRERTVIEISQIGNPPVPAVSRRSPVLVGRAPAMHVASQRGQAHPRQLVPRARRRGLRGRTPALRPSAWSGWTGSSYPNLSSLRPSAPSCLQLPSSELEEILLGIEASGKSFLLAFRTDVVPGDPSPFLPAFLDRYKSPKSDLGNREMKGMIVPWAAQRKVLLHSSVGGCFTHSGWNSALESISAAVPMIGKPIMGDQLGIRRFAVDRWKIAFGHSRGQG
ncbi:hypothetical protein SELMODRAFT_404252 [Selaginella moellendorffii]|uniref:UDP-glycosyltransferases domain-containing protein n=1 Tax=Selaginella moellendorffii TaxID=88036 RepID=D8QUR8_SELML|nr:hypothetical protein SELMODRAFT_404252 [Selaginella moellendorffii]